MVCGTFTTSNIPDGKQQGVIDLYKANAPPPTKVDSAKQPDGTWTVVATWPPCPAGTAHDPG
jgi:hypothetical protein